MNTDGHGSTTRRETLRLWRLWISRRLGGRGTRLRTPYSRQITIRLDTAAVDYFKEITAELGMPYQNLINLFLRDCAIEKRRPVIQWPQEPPKRVVGR